MTAKGFEPRRSAEIDFLMARAYHRIEDLTRLKSGLHVVADALNEGDLTRAMIASTLLRLSDLDWDSAARLARAEDLLVKYDPNEPRDWHGRWTNEGERGADAENTDETREVRPDTVTDVAYNGVYHDEIVAKLARIAKLSGFQVLTEVKLIAVNGATARADLLMVPPPGEPLTLVEVKTGIDPTYTRGQSVLYPMAMIGEHVLCEDPRIGQLGYLPGQRLPAMAVIVVYKKDKRTPLEAQFLPNPLVK